MTIMPPRASMYKRMTSEVNSQRTVAWKLLEVKEVAGELALELLLFTGDRP